jgi:hypothetical protein
VPWLAAATEAQYCERRYEMSNFIHLKRLGGYRASRTALRHYAYYRRCRLAGDVSLKALQEFHVHESTGIFPVGISEHEFSRLNGYANGKWVAKLSQDMIIEDLQKGNVVKAEFMNSSHLAKLFGGPQKFRYAVGNWFIQKYLSGVVVMASPFWLPLPKRNIEKEDIK